MEIVSFELWDSFISEKIDKSIDVSAFWQGMGGFMFMNGLTNRIEKLGG